MNRLWLGLIVVVVAVGCGGGNNTPDAFPAPFDADLSRCLLAADRDMACEVDLSGNVFAFDSRTAFSGANQIRVNTVFDFTPVFPPAGCPTLDAFTTLGNGTFSRANAPCNSSIHPPTLLLMVDDPQGAQTNRLAKSFFTFPLTCAANPPENCGAISTDLLVPEQAVATTWRDTMENDGMPNARGRGLALITFLEADTSLALGVTPFVRTAADRNLTPATEVRFLGSDRRGLVQSNAPSTTISGVAVIGVDGESATIGGRRGADVWGPVEVALPNGWFNVIEITLP